MLTVKQQAMLSSMREYTGMSLREIAAETGYHFNTVKKYGDKEDWNEEYKARKPRTSGLEPLKEVIDGWLREDMKRKRKHRRTVTKIYNDLKAHTEYSKQLTVGRQTIGRYVKKRRAELMEEPYKAAMYTEHSMCEAQVDFGEVLVEGAGGVDEKWRALIVSFPWSNAGFIQVCRNETKECLCEGLQKIFEHIGGVPYRILFDNMSSAVVSIEANGEREQTEMFMRFTMHHRYRAVFYNPESPHEKGNVENKVGYLRRNYLLPPPRIENLKTFNEALLEKCNADHERDHYRKDERISGLFAQEQAALIPLPREPFRVYTLEKGCADKYGFVTYSNTPYSTAPEYAKREVWLEVGANEIRILNEKYEYVVTHTRRHDKKRTPEIRFENYIPTLVKKPRAFMQSPFFQTLPETLKAHLQRLAYNDLKKTLLALMPILQDGKAGDAAAVLELSEIRNADDFLLAYRALTEDPTLPAEVTTPLTPKQTQYQPKLAPYSALQRTWGG